VRFLNSQFLLDLVEWSRSTALSPEPACVPEECFDQDDGDLFVLSLAILSTVQLELHVCEVCLTQELKQNRMEISIHSPGC
jgi:hypothetical protein